MERRGVSYYSEDLFFRSSGRSQRWGLNMGHFGPTYWSGVPNTPVFSISDDRAGNLGAFDNKMNLFLKYGWKRSNLMVKLLPKNRVDLVFDHLVVMDALHAHVHRFRMRKTLSYICVYNKFTPLQRAVKDWYYSPRSKYAITTIEKCDKKIY